MKKQIVGQIVLCSQTPRGMLPELVIPSTEVTTSCHRALLFSVLVVDFQDVTYMVLFLIFL